MVQAGEPESQQGSALEPPMKPGPAARLRALLAENRVLAMPCCFDALSARLIEAAGFGVTFMSGFAVAAARLGLPDTGLMCYAEALDQGRSICQAVRIPVIGDADTGYGNAINVKRTVQGYAAAGFAGVMIEDQVWPKRCGHTLGKAVVERAEAVARIQAAVDARNEGQDILIVARTDARGTHGLGEAIARAEAFAAAGADILFIEAPASVDEMATLCRAVPGRHLANMLEGGRTPILPLQQLQELGFALAAYPLTLLSAAVRAMQDALADLGHGRDPSARLMPFDELRRLVGFQAYEEEEERYRQG